MQTTLFLGALCAFTGVAFGAFGAHGLKTIISPEMLVVYQTGVTYQMWHALGLITIALLQQSSPAAKLLIWAANLMFIGIVLFSGSLYALAILDIKALGMITPFGGVCFLIAWGLVAVYAVKKKTHNRYS
ncbi:MAG: DUF423 domain-containing protein [Methylococcales bacterium]